MTRWERAARELLETWPSRRHVTGALVCGSHVTGHPTPHSDVDLFLVLAPGTRWRERGNRRIDGLLVEYFANPPDAVAGYLASDHATNRRITATMLATGRMLFDARGDLARLVTEGRRWRRKPFRRLRRDEVEPLRYALWDTVDNTLDAAERAAPDLSFVYQNALRTLYEGYARFLRQPVVQPDRIARVYGTRRRPRPYGLPAFPDEVFMRGLLRAQCETAPTRMPGRVRALARRALEGMGGFEIDGWRFRSPAR